MEFEAVIGLEVHAQLATASKIFCPCRAKPATGLSVGESDANLYTCPVCAGLPGALPVLNRKAVKYAVMAGLATECTVRTESVFARKNYFYPDLPKGYQISQFDRPICEKGRLLINTSTGCREIGITRIHMEEDAGKNVHLSGYSLVNLNRAGVPLIEIVSEPEMKSAEEAVAYLRALHEIVIFLGICDGNMQEGNFRCDANVSVRPHGSPVLGTRTEIKNINSFRFIEKAIDFEIRRQIEVVKSGAKVVQETRSYDPARNVTQTLRSKEEAQDYRYFPEPDLPPIQVPADWLSEIQQHLPELPAQMRQRFQKNYGLKPQEAAAITASRALAAFFDRTVQLLGGRAAKAAANWITGEVLRLVNEAGQQIESSRITPQHIAALVELTATEIPGTEPLVSSTGAKQALAEAFATGEAIQEIVERLGLKQVSDSGAMESAVEKIIAGFPDQVAEYRSGKEKVLGFLVGQVMKQSGGKANPSVAQELLKKKLS